MDNSTQNQASGIEAVIKSLNGYRSQYQDPTGKKTLGLVSNIIKILADPKTREQDLAQAKTLLSGTKRKPKKENKPFTGTLKTHGSKSKTSGKGCVDCGEAETVTAANIGSKTTTVGAAPGSGFSIEGKTMPELRAVAVALWPKEEKQINKMKMKPLQKRLKDHFAKSA